MARVHSVWDLNPALRNVNLALAIFRIKFFLARAFFGRKKLGSQVFGTRELNAIQSKFVAFS